MIAAEPRTVLIFCEGFRRHGQRCKTILGTIVGDQVIVRHRGREVTCPKDSAVIKCENCSHEWRGANR